MDDTHVILSLGGDVQSTTLALLARRGELPLPEAAIFVDTDWEPAAVDATIDWPRAQLDGRIPLHVVQKRQRDGGVANIHAETPAVMRAERLREATTPVDVREAATHNPSLLRATREERTCAVLPVDGWTSPGRRPCSDISAPATASRTRSTRRPAS